MKRFNRNSLPSALAAAYCAAKSSNRPAYVYATAYGLTVELTPPVTRQTHSVVSPDGKHTYRVPIMPGTGYEDRTNPIV
jgi:hypothetical protein